MALFFKSKKRNKGLDYKIQEIGGISKSESAASLNVPINNDEVVAAIMGAIMTLLSDTATSDIKIRSIRRIGRVSPVWNIAGRDEYIASKL
ncbi:MAG: hypothetical protein GX957_06445 [Clostridiaceae bacterium]|nr:hypothetical protein [Clostridiaceae bacterium]